MFRPLLRWIAVAPYALAFGAMAFGEQGSLLTKVFLPEDYRGEAQVADVVQTPDGLVYAANLGAIKEYDGHSWRSIPVEASWILDLEAAPDGRVYVAGVDELGFLEAGPLGQRSFRSLLSHVPADLQPLGQQWTVNYHNGAAYWATNRATLRWRDGALRVWRHQTEGRRALYPGGQHLYLASAEEGIFRLEEEEWVLVSNDGPARNLPSALFDGWPDTGLVLFDRGGRTWRLAADGTAREWANELTVAINAVAGARLQSVIRLRDDRVALSTKNAGVLVLNQEGRIEQRIGTESGQIALNLFGLSQDQEGGLWVGTVYGCVRIELDPSLTLFDHQHGGPPGNLYRLARHEGRLYVAAEEGLFAFQDAGDAGTSGRFVSVVSDEEFIPYDILSHPSGLLIGGDRGLFQLREGKIVRQFVTPHSIYAMARSTSDPARIFLSGMEYLHTLRWTGSDWEDEGPVAEALEDGRSLVEDDQGILWLGTANRGVARVQRRDAVDTWQTARVERYGVERGLPPGHDWVSAYPSAQGPLFSHSKGVSRYDAGQDRLQPVPELEQAGIGGLYTYPLVAGRGSALWLQLGSPSAGDNQRFGGVWQTEQGWQWKELSPAALAALGYLGAGDLVWEPDEGEGVLWMLGQQKIVRWDLNGAMRSLGQSPPTVNLRRILRGEDDLPLPPATPGAMPFTREPLRVRFAAPVFAPGAPVLYQYRLAGYNARWSSWSGDNEATFTNLPGGRYQLEVRARRGASEAGAVAAWDFTIQPPWWWSGPALVGYALLIAGLIWLLLQWRLAWLVGDRARLERVVRERTDELACERDRAEAANRAKTMFLASMSHELRTPLHAILGYSQLLSADTSLPEATRGRLQLVASSGEHLLGLINEVLDLSKIEAGKSELRPGPFDLRDLLREIGQSQAPRAVAKGLSFYTVDWASPTPVMGDAAKLRQVLDNLISNAIKFTRRGEVLCDVSVIPGGWRFSVRDTGPGISANDLRQLFQPFSRAGATVPEEEATVGTGLGLTIAQRLVSLMGGQLEVESSPGQGSHFWFELPLGAAPEAHSLRPRALHHRVGYEGRRRQVLAVDDVEANRLLFRDLLQPLGFEVALAANATEAWASLSESTPDLILLDLRLPGTSGFDLARALRQDSRYVGIKILAASASVFGHDAKDAIAAGCDGFILKPFLPENFFAQVQRLLELTWQETTFAAGDREEPLDPGLLQELKAAAVMGDVVSLRAILQRLQDRHPQARQLGPIARAIDAFDTERVVQLAS